MCAEVQENNQLGDINLKVSEYKWYLKLWMNTITKRMSIAQEEIQKLIAMPLMNIRDPKTPNESFVLFF